MTGIEKGTSNSEGEIGVHPRPSAVYPRFLLDGEVILLYNIYLTNGLESRQ